MSAIIKSEIFNDIPRRRGRPIGKNRIPLSLEERRARNAQYERERRTETAEAMNDLAIAAGCDPDRLSSNIPTLKETLASEPRPSISKGISLQISNAELLATVISRLQKVSERRTSDDLDQLRRINQNLIMQITALEDRFRNESPSNVNSNNVMIKIEQLEDASYQLEELGLPPQFSETSFHTQGPDDENFANDQTTHNINLERVPYKRCLSECIDEYGTIPKLKIIKMEKGVTTIVRTSSGKNQEIIFPCEDNYEYNDQSKTINIEVTERWKYEPQVQIEEVQLPNSGQTESSVWQETQLFEKDAFLPYIEQSDSENHYQTQPHSNLDLFSDAEKGVLSAWCESILNQSENVHEMIWSNDD